ncbi:photosynthetic complex putative assembly protein PuhB [Sulfitobacter sabulilitoris]|uniref:PH domain-containing protein n=1 Tax=Sulfitobacter sabulilitoris TaxID=2562655 RepID=A0A5S3PAL1_9RHOB|nr:photosynthetic complex putative assembly protein PuhB [Sulfitobacter sabulilitoris]TMM50554.1 PH domain-containing protein [Sulfitobacter sabulilitoris]
MSHDDFQIEPVEGLPEAPPQGEQILWQGRPDWWALSLCAMNLKWVVGYFGVLAIWRYVAVMGVMAPGQAVGAAVPFLVLGGVVCGMLMLVAYVQARATVYTVTDARVVMRIGAALTLTLNLPYTKIGNAMLDLRKNGSGTIALDTMGDTQLGYLVCWPHVRPWHMKQTQPALRCIPNAQAVATLIAEAAEARIAQPKVTRVAPQHDTPVQSPGLAGVAAE